MTPVNTPSETFSVTELNLLVKDMLESNLPSLWVEAEISNLARPASGHLYFSLKDERCQVRCAMFRNKNRMLDFKPANGDMVLARVKVGFYEPRGEFQLIVERMQQAGDGQLQQKFEQLKNKLLAEGLFDESNKLEIPVLPRRISVITSATGAAIRDVISVLNRRFPAIPVTIHAVPVQGEAAAPAIVRAIQQVSEHATSDVLLLVRGGGSLEDLWAFNEESVARAIHNCNIPVITGVGHETDTTIADFVADVRGATPSAAAELVSPDQNTYLQTFDYYQNKLEQILKQKLDSAHQQLGWLSKRLQQQHPLSQLAYLTKQKQDLTTRLYQSMQTSRREKSRHLQLLTTRLQHLNPENRLQLSHQELHIQGKKLITSIAVMQAKRRAKLSELSRTLHALSPLQTLSRGYSITTLKKQRKVLQKAADARINDELNIQLQHGSITAKVTQVTDK